MASLTIPDLPDEVHEQLRLRAAKNHRSIEAEARSVLVDSAERARRGAEAPFSSMGLLRGQIEIVGDWAEGDREVEAIFEESINKPLR